MVRGSSVSGPQLQPVSGAVVGLGDIAEWLQATETLFSYRLGLVLGGELCGVVRIRRSAGRGGQKAQSLAVLGLRSEGPCVVMASVPAYDRVGGLRLSI